MDAKHTPGPWRWEYNASSKSVSIVGGATRYETVMDFARWGMGRAAPMFSEAVTDPQGWHIITRLPDRPDWVAPIPGREHHKDWCMTVIHPDAVLMARAPELLAETTRLRAEVDLVIAQREAWRVSAIACQRSSAKFAAEADRLRAELENVRLLASRHRTEEWAGHMLRFCAEAGVKPSPFRGALQGDKP